MKIIVKSIPTNWEKEKSGKKSFTSRRLDGKDTIRIINRETGEPTIKRITNIRTLSNGEIIIDFKPLKKELKVGDN